MAGGGPVKDYPRTLKYPKHSKDALVYLMAHIDVALQIGKVMRDCMLNSAPFPF